MIKVWVDDVRPAPEEYTKHYSSVWSFIHNFDIIGDQEYLIDLDHDAGDYERFGGDYYNILKWLEYSVMPLDKVTFKFHTSNPVGKQNMINICERNQWKYIN